MASRMVIVFRECNAKLRLYGIARCLIAGREIAHMHPVVDSIVLVHWRYEVA